MTEPGERLALPGKWLLLFILAGIAAGIIWDLAFGRLLPLRPEAIRDWLDGFGVWAPVVYMAALAFAVVVSPVPSVPLDVAAGLSFGLVRGTIYTLIGAEIGAMVAFGIARRLGRPWLSKRLPATTMDRIDALAARSGVKAILLMRLLPVFQFDWVSYAAGLTAISFPAFAAATFVGMIPPVFAIVAVGATLPTRPWLAGTIFAVLVLLVLVPLIVPWPRRRRQRVEESGD
ncbi:MAG: TVP38/TMEM64 family protein [Thermomicrobiales bacterium]